METVEKTIDELEAEIATVSAALEDPQLYTRATGATDAATLGGQLERAKRRLDAALEQWSAATDEVEELNRELAASET